MEDKWSLCKAETFNRSSATAPESSSAFTKGLNFSVFDDDELSLAVGIMLFRASLFRCEFILVG